MNHAVKMYPMHTFENISHNWIIFPTHSRVRDNANNLKQNITWVQNYISRLSE